MNALLALLALQEAANAASANAASSSSHAPELRRAGAAATSATRCRSERLFLALQQGGNRWGRSGGFWSVEIQAHETWKATFLMNLFPFLPAKEPTRVVFSGRGGRKR